MNLLNGTTWLGDSLGLLLGFLLLDVEKVDWAVYVLVFAAFLLLSLALFSRNVEEYPVEDEEAEFATAWEYVQDKFRNIRSILCDPEKAVAICEFTLISAFYYNIMLWFPYYFTVTGY